MTDDKAKNVEVYTAKQQTPAERAQQQYLPGVLPTRLPSGVIDSAITGFVAGMEAHAFDKLTERAKAQTGLAKANTELANSSVEAMRALKAFDDYQATLDDDQAERDNARADRADARDESEHRREMNKLRRLQEKRTAETNAFNIAEVTKQNLMAQTLEARFHRERVADGVENFRDLHEARQDIRSTLEEVKLQNAQRELDPRDEAKASDPKQAYLDKLLRDLDEAVANGDHAAAEKLRAMIDFMTKETP